MNKSNNSKLNTKNFVNCVLILSSITIAGCSEKKEGEKKLLKLLSK